MFFSASQLVKSSAAQIKYMRDKPKKSVTAQMEAGDKFAHEHSISELIEMGGLFYHRGNTIAFSVDEVREMNRKIHLIEHKMVMFSSTEGYFRDCLIQTAFYGCLVSLVPCLRTSQWAKSDEYYMDLEKLRADKFTFHSFLNFGGIKYRVNFDVEPIMRFFLTKARATLSDWETAKRFDATYKDEWEYFKKCIKYRKA